MSRSAPYLERLREAIAFVGTASLLCPPAAAATEFDPVAVLRLAPSVLRIDAHGANGRVQLGSGVVVNKEIVVTNCHVTRAAQTVWVFHAGTRLPAKAQSADHERDLCLLQVPNLKAAPARLGSAAHLVTGAPVVALGFPGGVNPQVSTGHVLALHRWERALVIQSSTGFTSGASGGGLFNTQGELVGVLTFRLPGASAHYFAAPSDWLREQLAAPPRWSGIGPLDGTSYWERQGNAQPTFLKAAALEQERQWQALARLAEAWTLQASDDPEPPYMLAVAEDAMGRADRAIAAWRRSLDLDPDYHRSRMQLARIYHRLGREPEARQVIEALTARQPQLGRELTEELKLPAPSEPADKKVQ